MFGLFKKKLRDVVDKFSKRTEEEIDADTLGEPEEGEIKEEKPKRVLGLFKKKEIIENEPEKIKDESIIENESNSDEVKKNSVEEQKDEIKKEKKGLFAKLKNVAKIKINEEKFEKLFEDLEIMLLENNVAYEVIGKIKEDMKVDILNVPVSNVRKAIENSLKNSIESVLSFKKINLVEEVKGKKPYVILFLGVNGAGKTTTIAKICNLLLKNHLKCILVAADTFRAASIQQLEEHAKRLNVKVIKHDYNADPAAVCFDGIKHAEAKGIDVVLIDTAGRQHSNVNLMDELKKINRIAKPDFKIFVGESITGNDLIEQVKQFDKTIEIDGIILSKLDVDDKGGAAISVSYVTGKPILYYGTGQNYEDIEIFDNRKILNNLGI